MEVRIKSWMEPIPEPMELVFTLRIPNDVSRLMRFISSVYVSSLPSVLILVEDTIPYLAPNSLPISCMVWNVQGAGSRTFISALRDVTRNHKPNVFALVETHMGVQQAERIASIVGYAGHTRMDAQGFSWGIWVYCKPKLVTVEPIIQHNQHITMDIRRVGGDPWYFTALYASPNQTKRSDLWREIKDFFATHNQLWMLAGDFNDTQFGYEQSTSCPETSRRAARFNEWVEDMNLLEFSGPNHTWARGNSMATRTSARLDRALCNGEWSLRFANAEARNLPAV
ncbi:uncharacterized protein LOC110711279 [Chenopodium quinoa]|uniref:uncharacterized protein LOC110711279 n=1 Tax=Chenopodium quinoa TaxID=63459 RepID=UPI000B77C57B|nr:uncharacterized protein LOC110711279 [Chenopodium quinoa]